jgi:hypothetical protein
MEASSSSARGLPGREVVAICRVYCALYLQKEGFVVGSRGADGRGLRVLSIFDFRSQGTG